MQIESLMELVRQLAGPLGLDRFNAEVRERRTQLTKAALDPEVTHHLMDLTALERILDGSEPPVETTDIFDGSHILRMADILHRSQRRVTHVASEYLSKGATLRVRDIERSSEFLTVFARSISQVFAAHSQINLYLTPPSTDGFPPHFDNTDVFILQIVGSKKWSLHHDYSNRVRLPNPDIPWDPQRFIPSGEAETHVLEVGDVLYLPRGAMHSAACTGEESLHLTISLRPLTVAELLQSEVYRLSLDDPGLRERVVWSLDGAAPEAEHLRETMRGWLQTLADRIDPEQTIAVERTALADEADQKETSTLAATIDRLRAKSDKHSS